MTSGENLSVMLGTRSVFVVILSLATLVVSFYNDGKDCRNSNLFKCENGRCIHIYRTCDGKNNCYDGSDESPDICHENRTCPDDYFLCGSSGQCISSIFVCDGPKNCKNGEDEEGCQNRLCSKDRFKCGSPKFDCIFAHQVCDGRNDCSDNSDESSDICNENRICPDDHYSCKSLGQCIFSFQVCDTFEHCRNGQDEKGCQDRPCSKDSFKCGSPDFNCILPTEVCNGYEECSDNSDESPDICNENRICPDDHFSCGSTGQCIYSFQVCDNFADCKNGKDEEGCHKSTTRTPFSEKPNNVKEMDKTPTMQISAARSLIEINNFTIIIYACLFIRM